METLRDETSGEVEIAGYSINKHQTEIKSIIGIQLQQSGFYPNLSLVDLIALFCGLYDTQVDAMELLAKVDLKDRAKEKYEKLSGGQKQRFSIATTLINKPQIIFLDEPTTGLDPQARRNLWELISDIRNQGTTIVITTHYMDEAEYLCDRIAIVDEGQIVALDTPDMLVKNLIDSGFKKEVEVKQANLEDVFINLTGKKLRD
jgi:ABC-2 type transport system ATP-binding protein